jgi:multicomponent Na+:H+ antiporter subunit A
MPEFITNPNLAVMLLCAAFSAPLLTVLYGMMRPARTGLMAIATTAACFVLVLVSYATDEASVNVPWAETFGLRFYLILDGVAQLYALLATGIGLLVVIYAYRYIPLHLAHHHRSLEEQPRFFGFFLLFMAAMVGLVMAEDMILQFVFWDLTAIASFFLIGFDRDQEDSRSSAMMALLVTGISAVLVLIGVLMLRTELGTYAIPEVIANRTDTAAVGIAMALIGIGALAKSAQVPLHFWLPRAMAAPTPVSAYLHSAAMVAAGVFMIRRFYPLIAEFDVLLDAMLVIGFLSIAVGGVISLTRDNMKQILAYSTISQYGYVVVMFGLGNAYGLAGATFYVLAHALVKSALFMTAGAVTEATGTKYMSKTGGLARRMPLLAVGSGLAAAGLIAMPITIGFFKDELFFAAAWERGPVFGVLAVASAALTFAYVSRFWIGVFLGPLRKAPSSISRFLTVPVVVLGGLTVLFGLWTTPVVDIAEAAASLTGSSEAHIQVAYHLDLRHQNVMALVTWIAGALLVMSERYWAPAARMVSTLGDIYGPERQYTRILDGLERISDKIHRVEVRDLRSRVATILAPAGILVGLAVIFTPNSDAFEIGPLDRSDLPLATMLLATALAAFAVAIPRGHLRIVITTSCVGFSLSVIYSLLGAPDVALVAVLVETVLGVFFICMLLLMPRSILRFETREPAERVGVRRDVVLALLTGAMAFFVVWGVLSRPAPSHELIDLYEELTPLAHGEAVVTVILADFRGFDTLGEITVISLVMLGVMSLIRKGRLR